MSQTDENSIFKTMRAYKLYRAQESDKEILVLKKQTFDPEKLSKNI